MSAQSEDPREIVAALAKGDSIEIDGVKVTRLPGTFVCGRYRVDVPGHPHRMAWDPAGVVDILASLRYPVWTVWELNGSFFALQWLAIYMAREYGTPETFN